jgi:hypothetical protein
MASVEGPLEQLLGALDLDTEVVSYLAECLLELGTSASTDEVAEVLAPFADELEMSDEDAVALAEDVVATLVAPRTTGGSTGAPRTLQPAPEPALERTTEPQPEPAARTNQQPADDPNKSPFAHESLPYGGDWNAAMAAQDRAAVRQILEYRDRVAAEATAKTAREERAAQLAQQQAAQEPREERRVDPADGNAYTRQEFIDVYGGTAEWDATGRPPEPEPELKGLSGNAKPFSMSAAAAAPVFEFGARENAWGPVLGQQPQQPRQWGSAGVPGPPAGKPPNRHQWDTQQQQQQQQQWPLPQQQEQQRQQQPGLGVAPAQLDFATKLKLGKLQEAYPLRTIYICM